MVPAGGVGGMSVSLIYLGEPIRLMSMSESMETYFILFSCSRISIYFLISFTCSWTALFVKETSIVTSLVVLLFSVSGILDRSVMVELFYI